MQDSTVSAVSNAELLRMWSHYLAVIPNLSMRKGYCQIKDIADKSLYLPQRLVLDMRITFAFYFQYTKYCIEAEIVGILYSGYNDVEC